MKKILMVVTFLLVVAMVPAAHAGIYKLNAYDIWFDTGIVLTGGSITFSNAQTYATLDKYNSSFDRPTIGNLNGWTSDGGDGYYRDEWTWGIEYYRNPDTGGGLVGGYGVRPYVWTDADGGYGPWLKYVDGIVTDAWYKEAKNGIEANHGMLIGYIGYDDPRDKAGNRTTASGEVQREDLGGDLSWLNAANTNIFGIGTATVTQFGTGHVWLGFNDGFNHWDWAFPDNSGYATVNIPEPASMLLLFFGLMGVLGLRRKFKS